MPEDLTPLEAALAGVSPAPPRLDRDALMYVAGRASVRRPRLWPAIAAGFALLSMGLGVRLATVEPRVVERTIFVRDTAAEPGPYPSAGYDVDESRYDALLRRTTAMGELPAPPVPQTPADGAWSAPLRPLLEHDLDFPPGSLRNVGPRPTSVPPNSR